MNPAPPCRASQQRRNILEALVGVWVFEAPGRRFQSLRLQDGDQTREIVFWMNSGWHAEASSCCSDMFGRSRLPLRRTRLTRNPSLSYRSHLN